MIKVSVLRSPEIHDWERFVIVSDGMTTICEICDSREVRQLVFRLERELTERNDRNGGTQSERPTSEPVCETI